MNAKLNLLKNKQIRNWCIAVTAVVVVTSIGLGLSSTKTVNAAVATEATVVSLNVAEKTEASGSLEVQPFASLDWKTSGVVESVNIKPGDFVKAGDILLTLQPESTSANIVSAQADLVTAQKNLDDLLNSDSDLAQDIIDLKDAQEDYDSAVYHLKYLQNEKKIPLVDSNVYVNQTARGYEYQYKTRHYKGPATKDMLTEAANDLELKRATLEDLQRKVDRLKNKDQDVLAAQARVDAAQATVNSLSIIAPFDGQVLSVENRAGDTVNASELSVNLADMDHLYVETQVDESDIAKVKVGNQAEVTLDAVPGVVLTGKVSTINPVGEVISGLVKYKVRVDLDKAKGDIFLPLGTTANVVIQIKSASAVLTVPIAAIQNDNAGEYVWVIQSDGSVKRIDIVSGAIIGTQVAVSGSLVEGNRLQLVHENSFEAPNPFGGGTK